MDYGFKLLRNNEPVADKETAIALLDNFRYHKVGQPLAIRYYNGSASDVQILFAIGIKDYDAIEDNDVPGYGPDYYRIIGGEKSIVFWEQFEQRTSNLEETGDKFRAASMTQSEFDEYARKINGASGASDTVVSFVNNQQGGDAPTNSIYKGADLYGTTDLNKLVLGNNITIDGDTYSGNIGDILEQLHKLINEKTSTPVDLRWDILCQTE